MAKTQMLNIDALLLDPFVSKLHLVRDIGESSLESLFNGCTQAFGEKAIKRLLTLYCMQQLHNIPNIDDNEMSSTLRASLTRHHETFNPSNPALLDVLPAVILSKCFSYLDVHTLLCSVELVSRDWFHISRLASSISEFPATAIIPSDQQSVKLQRLTNATTLNFSDNNTTPAYQIDLIKNIHSLQHIERLNADGVLPTFLTKCPDTFPQQLHEMSINYSSTPIESEFWESLVNKCDHLYVLKLKNIIISKQAHPVLIKFISSCKNMIEFECHRWRFSNANMTVNGCIKALSEHCRSLHTLRIEFCRINDKAIAYIVKLMEYKLRSLSIINCNRLKMSDLNKLGQKQHQLLSKTLSKTLKNSKNKRLYEFIIDDKMITGSIFDSFCGLKSLSISSDHLSGNILYSMLNKFNSLQNVCIEFRSSIDRLSSHSSSQFDWKLFFGEIGKTLINFECNCCVIKHNEKTNISDLKLLNKDDYDNFMMMDHNIFVYISSFCIRLKTLKMSGWKFSDQRNGNENEDEKQEDESDTNRETHLNVQVRKKTARSQSMWFLNGKQRRYNKAQQIVTAKRFDFNETKHKRSNSNKMTKDRAGSVRNIAEKDVIENKDDSIWENMIMIPISSILQLDKCLDYMKLEWMFEFGDIPSLNTLNFWCDTVLGLKCTMSMNEELKAGSVLILEWNENWAEQFITPTIICHQSKPIRTEDKTKYKSNTKQRLRKMRKHKQDESIKDNGNDM